MYGYSTGAFETRYFRDYVWIVGHIGWDYQTDLEGFLPWIEQGSLFLLHSARYLPENPAPLAGSALADREVRATAKASAWTLPVIYRV
ncbi:hypothetical protein H7F10_15895 [Acidithiobacillus sp. HP-6]|uniref:hypothetical protein n=1 Tax=unclassified Acidithiobacillus TaxID=2614800 RepID=UPI001879AAEB|nr:MULTISPECIES: hypothetical protein [unclassified Acidithiobacillus]MBE7564372.1 hypothetical protein [Acidithiobacillus sp. HP-6]MBE7571011.1 hypothetical protein [Acidithiobacillus sp. HP-2]